ncbi:MULTISPECIES: ComEA family DNA-binding protein [unclassified Robiginitalea]|uniref:ComEA family DNA-binding protein n=1 Tax=Robiginitalea TaxID=252306 RepID=UPI0023498A67|nr:MULTISPECIES: helix-hairpin-helix domain-containing protein [unclassified Robiginitalea]MDC6354720.1 helix-hairpin-helix domain-containing protein [Robiginitalea sp. PM2]MDC6374598.1 helix-hairpin-helix domain-containing protein [Robiginitalea sp. SP8]
MRRPESHFRSNQRIRSGIFYFMCLMLLLECARRSAPGWGAGFPVAAGPDTTFTRVPDTPFTRIPDTPVTSALYRIAGKPDSFAVRQRHPDASAVRVPHSDTSTLRVRPPGRDEAKPNRFQDLNQASASDLQAVRGIGPVLSARIVKFRDALGGFQHAGQLYDVYGLPPEVARRAALQFRVVQPPPVRRIDINDATVEELAALVYLDWQMARDIVARRNTLGPYESLEELREIGSIPGGRIERIALYLSLEKQ